MHTLTLSLLCEMKKEKSTLPLLYERRELIEKTKDRFLPFCFHMLIFGV
jgi:hypothetical protein